MKAQDATYWICQIAGWGTYSVIGCLLAINGTGARFSVIAGYFLFALYSIGLTHLLRREIRRRAWRNAVPRLALAVFATATTQTALVLGFGYLLSAGHNELLHPGFAFPLWGGLIWATGMWTVLYVFLSGRRRELQLKLALQEANLRAIETQINPHFLFNSLNSIRAMVVENPPLAQDMITRLATLLRHNLKRGESSTVPLEAEMEAVSNYLAIEAVRFEERLRVSIAIDPEALQFPVPAMMLQTLVENAIKHGIAHLPAGGEVAIEAKCTAGALLLEVVNTGQLGTPQSRSQEGGTRIGLTNIRERLRLLYGGRALFALTNRPEGNVSATVTIPRVS